MSDDAWLVNNPRTQEFHDLMVSAVQRCRAILDQVEATLATMPAAAQTKGLIPWEELKLAWNNDYNEMARRIQAAQQAGVNAHEAYHWGDRTSVQIMS